MTHLFCGFLELGTSSYINLPSTTLHKTDYTKVSKDKLIANYDYSLFPLKVYIYTDVKAEKIKGSKMLINI